MVPVILVHILACFIPALIFLQSLISQKADSEKRTNQQWPYNFEFQNK